jgi:hypothetical protein
MMDIGSENALTDTDIVVEIVMICGRDHGHLLRGRTGEEMVRDGRNECTQERDPQIGTTMIREYGHIIECIVLSLVTFSTILMFYCKEASSDANQQSRYSTQIIKS